MILRTGGLRWSKKCKLLLPVTKTVDDELWLVELCALEMENLLMVNGMCSTVTLNTSGSGLAGRSLM